MPEGKSDRGWEPWHFEFTLNAGTCWVGWHEGERGRALPSFVPARFAPALGPAAQRWNVSAPCSPRSCTPIRTFFWNPSAKHLPHRHLERGRQMRQGELALNHLSLCG
jgi:hypothetical protein